MNSLTELLNESSEIEKILADSGGELTPELEQRISNIDVNLPTKIDSYDYLIKRMANAAEFYKQRAQLFTKFSKSCDAISKRIKDSLKFKMINNGLTEISGIEVRFNLRNNKKTVFISDESAIPAKYKILITTEKVDLDKVKDDLEAGIHVPGADLLQSKSILSYPCSK